MMIKYLMILPILFASPAAVADTDTGIPFRVSALEERVDWLELHAMAEVSGIVLFDSGGQPIGSVFDLSFWNARIWMDFPDRSAIFILGPDGFRVSKDVPPEVLKHVLLFETPDCNLNDETAPVYAPNEHFSPGPWPQYKVIVAPAENDADARVPYAKIDEAGVRPIVSALWSDGYCGFWDGGPGDPQDTFVTPVVQLTVCDESNDLHVCYPPPYELARP
jgi:hypothetical protein